MRNFEKDYSLVRFLHAVPGADEVDVYLNGNTFFNDMEFSKFTPYVYIPKGTYTVEIYESDTKDKPLLRENLQINAQELLTVAVVSQDGTLKLLPIKEDMELASGTESKLRYVNLVPNGRVVNVLLDGKPVFSNVKYKDITQYTSIPPKDYKLDIESVDNKQIIRSVKLGVNPNRIYTIYAIGESPNFKIYQSLDGASFMN